MRKEKNIYNQQITARLTNDLVNRVDAICEEKMLARGSVIRNWIQRAVRDEEHIKQPHCDGQRVLSLN